MGSQSGRSGISQSQGATAAAAYTEQAREEEKEMEPRQKTANHPRRRSRKAIESDSGTDEETKSS
jgi:hypothetical protein